jgi:alkanesulfonate monooxygenase SsuD/methylene tetrahydromethanopterin reductase-like flavin-dependent oxidoreductase (luciferase family)
MATLGSWAARAEEAGFDSVGVIDRLVYDNLDPLTALAAAAASTQQVELLSSVINVCWRNNAVLLAKQLSSVNRLSGNRLVAGLGMGGWPDDYAASGVSLTGRKVLFESIIGDIGRVWQDTGHPVKILLAGTVPASFRRAAAEPSLGWVAPLFALPLLQQGAAAVQEAWNEASRPTQPRIATGRYFSLGPKAEETADNYIEHYYGSDYYSMARADTLTNAQQINAELTRLSEAGCTDALMFPCAGGLEQVGLLAEAIQLHASTAR